MKIEKMKLSSIRPYENNAKLHPQSQIDQIAASILEFGNNDPIAVDENGVIIEGHGPAARLHRGRGHRPGWYDGGAETRLYLGA